MPMRSANLSSAEYQPPLRREMAWESSWAASEQQRGTDAAHDDSHAISRLSGGWYWVLPRFALGIGIGDSCSDWKLHAL